MTIKNALIVDDSKSARIMLQRLLEKLNVVSLSVGSAEEALSYLENERPDVIFMDHMMPGMDGLEATSTIKNNPKTQNIPTIMYTSKEGDSYISLAKSHGALGVLPKPANQQAVMAVIDLLDSTAANDVSIQTPDQYEQTISLETIEQLIQARLNSSILTARSEIAAGLDGVSHQLSQTNQEQLTIVERNLKQQVQKLQNQLLDLQDDHTLFKRLQPQIQKHAILVARKISQKKIESLTKEYTTKFANLAEQQSKLSQKINSKSQQAATKATINGALLGAMIAIAVGYFL